MPEAKAGLSVTPVPSDSALSVASVESVVPSSSLIVPVAAEGVPSVAFVGFDSVSVKVSALSLASSSVVGTSIVPVAVLSAAAMVSVPLVDVKSVPETADCGSVSDVA